MLKNKLLVAALASAFALPVLAADAPAAPAAPYTVTGNVGFISDYTFRGISQNFRTPSVQGGFDYVHESGVYLGTWGSNVSGNQYSNASMEWDMYGGYNGKVSDDFSYNVGLVSVFYPGGKTNVIATETTKKWDTTEVQFGGTFKGVNIAYHYALTDWFGISGYTGGTGGGYEPVMWAAGDTTAATGATTADKANASSKGSGYLEANYTFTFAEDVALLLHAGHQKINNFSKLSYTDYKIGISKPVGGFTLGAAYTSTNATDNNLYHVKLNGDDKKLGGGIFALSVSRSL
jgi:hypothetical protein